MKILGGVKGFGSRLACMPSGAMLNIKTYSNSRRTARVSAGADAMLNEQEYEQTGFSRITGKQSERR
jgi:hypothetical protein